MPQTTVAAIITATRHHQTCVLLTQRNIEPFRNSWCLPGGHIEPDEAAEAAIIREVQEETGLHFNARFFGCFDEIIPAHNIHAVVVVFEGYADGEPKAQESEVSQIEWFPIAEALRLDLGFAHRDILATFANSGLVPTPAERRTAVLQEYEALRQEIQNRITQRDQLLTLTLTIAGAVLGLASQNSIQAGAVLVYPLIATYLATSWAHTDVRILEAGAYIREHIETRVSDLGWESHLRQTHSTKTRLFGLGFVELSALGVFVLTQVLALIIAVPRLTYSELDIVLLVIDCAAIFSTYFVIRRRRFVF